MSPVVYLHVGAPKTGSAYIRDRLALNAANLARHGVTVPTKRGTEIGTFHFRAALDLLDQDWGGPAGHAEGCWPAMVAKAVRASSSVVISHEVLGPARPDQVAQVMKDLADCEIHIVYTARDLGRQLPAVWQESVKQGRRWTFASFLARLDEGETWFHRALDLPSVLNTWSSNLPPERVHVVTVPHERSRTELWQRFARAINVEPTWAPLDSELTHRSLGIAETQLLRQLNRRLGLGMHRGATYDNLIRTMLAEGELVNRETLPVTLPPDRYESVQDTAQLWIDWLEGSGVDVVGDVDDLRPRRPAEDVEWQDPDRTRTRQQLDAATDALAAMTREAAHRSDTLGQVLLTRARRLRGR
ncbi:hypothetical protein [Nocardioides gilvus]|uniref:hypothetical protein n=1 Tax=Nocardioides gilvus TaxID=1735589 RepID=UPI000D74BF87|nr:hypothetical protein [Nocardioides gilvus]